MKVKHQSCTSKDYSPSESESEGTEPEPVQLPGDGSPKERRSIARPPPSLRTIARARSAPAPARLTPALPCATSCQCRTRHLTDPEGATEGSAAGFMLSVPRRPISALRRTGKGTGPGRRLQSQRLSRHHTGPPRTQDRRRWIRRFQ